MLLTAASCTDFLRTGGASSELFRGMLKLDSPGPSTAAVVLLNAASCTDFLRTGGASREFFRSMLKLDSPGPSTAAVLLINATSCTDFLRTGGAPGEFFRSMLKPDSPGPSAAAVVRSTIGFGLTGGGVRVLVLCKGSVSLGSSSFGSGGKLKVRLGLGERIGGEAVWEM